MEEDVGARGNHQPDHSEDISMIRLLQKEIEVLKTWRMEVEAVLEVHGITLERCPMLSESPESLESKNNESTQNGIGLLATSKNVDGATASFVEGSAEMMNNGMEETPTKTLSPKTGSLAVTCNLESSNKAADEPKSQPEDVGLNKETPLIRYKCGFCSYSDASYDAVNGHVGLAHGFIHECPQCTNRYKRKFYLDRHILLKHSPGAPPEEKKAQESPQKRKRNSKSALIPIGVAPLLHKDNVKVADTDSKTLENKIKNNFQSFEYFKDSRLKRTYLCIVCGVLFDGEADIRQHIIKNHVSRFFSDTAKNSDELKKARIDCCAAAETAVTSDSVN